MVLITHDLGVVAQVTDEIVVMYAGRVIERAPTAKLFSEPQHPYTWGLLRSIPRLTADRGEKLVPIDGRPPSLITRPTGCHFHPRCPYVIESHKEIDPSLELIEGSEDHHVACLLAPQARRELWRRLDSGAQPDAARAAVPIKDAPK